MLFSNQITCLIKGQAGKKFWLIVVSSELRNSTGTLLITIARMQPKYRLAHQRALNFFVQAPTLQKFIDNLIECC